MHTFVALANAIDTAFARWDRSHLCLFELADGTEVCGPIRWENPPEGSLFAGEARLTRVGAGEQLLYTFDMGDDWTHLCTVAEQRIDPLDTLGVIPAGPLPYWGWGEIPDEYDRRTRDDDGETPLGPSAHPGGPAKLPRAAPANAPAASLPLSISSAVRRLSSSSGSSVIPRPMIEVPADGIE
ncbi:MAG TPA: hypothetical protein VES62_09365 [Thermoleophilaceae bacterium]|nr:hypothetical protein [Thermoleophilaceae bacterium]